MKVDKDSTGIKYYDSLLRNPIYYYWMKHIEWDIQRMNAVQLAQAAGYSSLQDVIDVVSDEDLGRASSASVLPMMVLDRTKASVRAYNLAEALVLYNAGELLTVMVVQRAGNENRERVLQMVKDGESYERVKFYSDHTDVPMTRVIYDRLTRGGMLSERTYTKGSLLEAASRRPINIGFYRNLLKINKYDPYIERILKDAEANGGATEPQIRVLAKFANPDHGRWPNKN